MIESSSEISEFFKNIRRKAGFQSNKTWMEEE
jgi:hypothetical protein